jgi:hypothetical protein
VTEQYDDERVRARLREADPASSLPPADAGWVDRLLEDTMSHDLLTESRETGTHGRSPLTWLVAAAAAVIIVGVGIFALVDDRGTNQPPPPSQAAPGSPSVTRLSAPSGQAYAARCAVPTAELLAPQQTAFDGTVTSIEDDVVTLAPSRWYAGETADEVQVDAPPEVLGQLLTSVEFEEGGRYLVAANNEDQVVVCGLSGPHTPRLERLYQQAFAG